MRLSYLSTSVLCLGTIGCIIQPPNWGDDDVWDTADETVGTAVVEFAWQVGASGCDDAGVETIEVRFDRDTRSFDCNDGRGSLAVDAAPGLYTLFARGLDADGESRYEGSIEGVEVRFRGETVQAGTVRLEARTGTVNVGWRFEDGELCATNAVEQIDIALFALNRIQYQTFATCTSGSATLDAVVAGDYEISLLGNDIDGIAQFSASAPIVVLEGEPTDVDLVLIEE